jgi:hypothetical protein
MTRQTTASIAGLAAPAIGTRPASAALAVLAALALAAVGLADPTALLFSAPLLAVLVPLLARRYPGERLLLRATRIRRRPRPVRVLAPPARKPRATLPTGGRLIAAGLAVRPPPLLSLEV